MNEKNFIGEESNITFKKLLNYIVHDPKIDVECVIYAKDFAKHYHGDQKRASGEPYYTHIIEVAYILAIHTKVAQDSLIAALLHDVIEDTPVLLSQIGLIFGSNVSFLVDKLSKLESNIKKFRLNSIEIEQKLILLKEENKDVIHIKLADRMHNMRTLHHFSSNSKKERIAKNTLEVFVPLAKYCDLEKIERELTYLSKKFL